MRIMDILSSILTLSGRNCILCSMDGDVFGRVTRIGRDAAEAVLAALGGQPWDAFCAERCLELLVATAGGVPSLPEVLRQIQDLNASPLLARVQAEPACDEIASIVRRVDGGILDLILRATAQKRMLQGVFDARDIVTNFVVTLLDRAVVYGRGSPIGVRSRAEIRAARERLRGVATRAAEELLQRPNAKRLGLTRNRQRITAETNLLGGRR
jgi:hypothetical protein